MERLLRRARALGVATGIVMPVDEIRLGYKLSLEPRARAVPRLLELAEDANMHARRVADPAVVRALRKVARLARKRHSIDDGDASAASRAREALVQLGVKPPPFRSA